MPENAIPLSPVLVTGELMWQQSFEVTRHVPTAVQCMLWGKAAGRCEFSGCNKPLWKSSVTHEAVNTAQKAHIYSFSANGAHGNREIDKERLNDLENLVLVCYECHQKIDRDKSGNRYSAAVLRLMKRTHEHRMELVGGITEGKTSHVMLYGANIGIQTSPLNYREAASAMFPHRYPASDVALELGTINASFQDRDTRFWGVETENLRRKFQNRVRERIANGEVKHLSVFAIAPQALLIFLGTLLGDIIPSDVYQRHREPPTWQWPETTTVTQTFELERPERSSGPPALVLALSATVTKDRVTSVIGGNASTWTLRAHQPHNDIVKSREQLSQLRSLLRLALDEIKAKHGQDAILNIFPAAPVSAAIELGRVRMPKAEMRWIIYDQVNARGGFVEALTIPVGEQL